MPPPFDSNPSTDPMGAMPAEETPAPLAPVDVYANKARLMEIFEKVKHECMEYRWIWEREWQRDLYYVNNRQWISYNTARREWMDKRLHKWIPRPVTNKMAETLQAIRTVFAAIDLAAKVRPVGNDTKNVSAAEVADQLQPLIHGEHRMDQVINEADFWLITTGSVLLHSSWDRDKRFNRSFIQKEQCQICGYLAVPQEIVQNNNLCPNCGNQQFAPALLPNGEPDGEWVSLGRGKTVAKSPFEWAFPPSIVRFDELPYLLLLRWREKSYYEANFPEIVHLLTWEKTPIDRSLQIFKTLALSNDVGTGSQFHTMGNAATPDVDGITEYELWMKPTDEFPKGLVMRVVGDRSPFILEVEDEGLPGPIPYTDIEGKVVWPFTFAQYEQIGGRLYGRSAISPLIQKQDQLNQIDSLIQLTIQRMANPIWVIPEGAGIDTFSGEPGFVMKWNPQAVGGTAAKPERMAGSDVPTSVWNLREQILKDIEDLAGTYDIIKGQKPTGVEAFSALQLLVERSQSRFTSVFKARGKMYQEWYAIALELERQFGPDQRVMTVVGPNKNYAFKHFMNSDLAGHIDVQVEDGSDMPKTSLGKRAAIEQAFGFQLIDPQDPDQKYTLLTTLGLSEMVPSLNVHVQAALQMQDAFETWTTTRQGPPPLNVKPWYNPQIHWAERIKWLNTDKMREILTADPMLEQLVMMHLAQLQMMMMPTTPLGPGQPGITDPAMQGAQGGAMAMANSNANSTSTSIVPSGNGQGAQGQGPV